MNISSSMFLQSPLPRKSMHRDFQNLLRYSMTSFITWSWVGCWFVLQLNDHSVLVFSTGGHQLTAARTRSSQRIRCNSVRGKDRLEEVVAVVEDWHAKVCLLGVCGSVRMFFFSAWPFFDFLQPSLSLNQPISILYFPLHFNVTMLYKSLYTYNHFMQVIWKRLYKCSSGMNYGTLPTTEAHQSKECS